MEIGTKVSISNPNQINYRLQGIVIEKETSPEGIKMCKVKFKYVECWYSDNDLEVI
jgi:hypothetical protein